MAGRLAFEPISSRTRPSANPPRAMKSYRPEFESLILGRPSGNLDSGKMSALSGIINEAYSEADRKGTGGKVREIFRDFAARINNNIVKLASQRIRDAVKEVGSERLQDFLEVMHREMLANPDRADAIPEAMLGAYRLSGGRLDAHSIARAVRIGFSKSKTLCPKEVTAVVKREYESGGLDHIGGVAALRNPQPVNAVEISFPLRQEPAAAQGDGQAPAALMPEAVPLAYFLQPRMPDEIKSPAMNYAQKVPEIVAVSQREEVRKMKERSRSRSEKEEERRDAPPRASAAEKSRPAEPARPAPVKTIDMGAGIRDPPPVEALRGRKAEKREAPSETRAGIPAGRKITEKTETAMKEAKPRRNPGENSSRTAKEIQRPAGSRAARRGRKDPGAKTRRKAAARETAKSGILKAGLGIGAEAARRIKSLLEKRKRRAPKESPKAPAEKFEKKRGGGSRAPSGRKEKPGKRRLAETRNLKAAAKRRKPESPTRQGKEKTARGKAKMGREVKAKYEAQKTKRARREISGTVCSMRLARRRKHEAKGRAAPVAVRRPSRAIPRLRLRAAAGRRRSGEIIFKLVVQS